MIRNLIYVLCILCAQVGITGCAESSQQSALEDDHVGEDHHAHNEDLEGRTRIAPEMAASFGLETAIAGSATIRESLPVYGRVVTNPERVRTVHARFAGAVQSVDVSTGDRVARGQPLARIESNESLQSYQISAPIDGVVTQRNANPGEQSAGRPLFTIIDSSSVWAELAVFPIDRSRAQVGTAVRVMSVDGKVSRESEISYINTVAEPNQSVLVRVVLDNADGAFTPGTFVNGELLIAEHPVSLAVKRDALQSLRDSTVVFAQSGDEYEARVLQLGRQDNQWTEVLSGLEPGTRYVTTNSYLVKADIEKAGAVHEH